MAKTERRTKQIFVVFKIELKNPGLFHYYSVLSLAAGQ